MLGLGAMVVEVDDSVGAGVSTDETDFAARFGGGIEAYLTETIALTFDASYVVPTDDLDDFNYVSLGWGLNYRFGGSSLLGR